MLKMPINIAVFGAFLLIVAILGFFLWQTLFASEKYSDGQEQAEPAYSEQQSSGKEPLGSRPPPSRDNRTDEAIAEYTKWLAIFTLFLVLATIGLFISGERSVQVAGRSARAGQQAAEAAKEAVKSTQTAMRLDQRAWLGIENIRPDPSIPQVGTALTVIVTFKNTGRTPARKMRGYTVVEPIDRNSAPDFSYTNDQYFEAGTIAPGAVHGPGVPATIDKNTRQPIPLPQAGFDVLQSGAQKMYVHGRIDYEDIFHVPHWLTFCAMLIVPFNGHFGFCREHNETDD